MSTPDTITIDGMKYDMPPIMGKKAVQIWAQAVDALCDSDPTYSWNRACRSVAHALETNDTVTLAMIYDQAVSHLGREAGRDVRVVVGDLRDTAIRTALAL